MIQRLAARWVALLEDYTKAIRSVGVAVAGNVQGGITLNNTPSSRSSDRADS